MAPALARAVRITLAVITIGAAGACSTSEKDATVVLDDYSISMEPARPKSGNLQLWIDQRGSQQHSFGLYRGKEPSDLPTTPEGAIDVVKSPPVDGVKVLAPGVYKTTLKEIRGADYVLACNLVTAGKAHFAEGMAMGIRVRRSDFDTLFDTGDEE